MLLAGCATQERYGGEYPVKGVCRSCRPHTIRGVRYTPQLYYDYDETAIASWYGPGFHGKQKANGEIFDQDEISAAHKTLPLPTVVKVTNLDNGKSLVMIVDDRGPYVDNRIIDLSKGAAKKLGVYLKGTSRVRVQSLPEHSHALSMHLARVGNKWGYVKGRTWREVYLDDIAHQYGIEPYERGSASRTHVPGYDSGYDASAQRGTSPTKATAHTKESSVHFVYTDQFKQGLDDLIEGHAVSSSSTTAASQKPAARKVTGPSSIPIGQTHYIQLASFVQESNAQKLVTEIGGLAQARVEKKVVPPGQLFYVVKCGPFPNKDAAEIALSSLDVFGHNPVLVHE